MMRRAFVISFLMALSALASLHSDAQITINIRYTSQDGGARKYVEEMEKSGIATRIRAIEGCLGYDYFYSADDPDGLLLIDSWENQEALNRYHSSPAMKEASDLREKYGLGGRTIKVYRPIDPQREEKSSEQKKP